MPKKELIGKLGEKVAVNFLKKNKYRILATNFKTKAGEIDIICTKNKVLTFVEVKTRVGDKKGKPYESVKYFKLKHLRSAIYYYLTRFNLFSNKLRADVVSVQFNSDLSIKDLKHFENLEL